jgi:hypothetical protein
MARFHSARFEDRIERLDLDEQGSNMKGFWSIYASFLAAALFSLGATSIGAAQASGGDPWAVSARQDVMRAYETFVADHPGMHDPANPGFPALLERARDAGLRVADRASAYADYAASLAAFSAVLQDGHALAFSRPPADAETATLTWPGFVAAWRGDLRVHAAGDDAPAPIGSEIVACDGRPVDEVLRERFRPLYARVNEPGQWWLRAPQAFVSGTEPDHPPPARCRFRLPDGELRDVALAWEPVPHGFGRMLALASDGERTPIGLGEPRPALFLIGLPDFSPGEAGIAAYRALFDELADRRDELRSARALVIDLRHNNGGSSHWPRRTAEELWGREVVAERMSRYWRDVRVLWRVSRNNAAHAESIADFVRARDNPARADAYERLAGQIRDGLARGDLYVEEPAERPATHEGPPSTPELSTPVYVITSGRCASACLDALDVFTRFENVTLIGAPTSADSPYMEIRVDDLPSGRGALVVPVKMWTGRPRAGGEVYEPAIKVTDTDWSTATFLDRIEAELGPGRNGASGLLDQRQGRGGQALAFVGGRWFTGFAFEERTVYAVDGVLTFQPPARVDSTIHLAGGYVVPPFGEAHNHNVEYSPHVARTIRQYLRDGVFYVKNPNNLPRTRHPLAGTVNIPTSIDVVFANGGLTVAGGHPLPLVQRNIERGVWTDADAHGAFYFLVNDEEELRRVWEGVLADRPDFLKTFLLYSEEYAGRKDDPAYLGWKGLDPALLPAIVRRAHQAGLRVSTHVETAADFHHALLAGVDEIAHMPGFRGDSAVQLPDPAVFEISAADARLAARLGTVVVTTVGGVRGIDPAGPDSLLRARFDRLHARNLRLLREHGVRLALGSDDYGDTSVGEAMYLHGLGVFDNLALLKLWAEATPRAIFPGRKLGCLQQGCEASFLVLRADPIVDFGHVRDIALRVKQGHILPAPTSEE